MDPAAGSLPLSTPLLSSGALTPPDAGRASPMHSGAVHRSTSWGGGLVSPGGAGGEGDVPRKPGQPVRETRARRTMWTVINAAGVQSTVYSDKRGIIQRFRLGVPIRDMRLMDASIFAPDAAVLLVRDNAIVLRAGHVRLIVTADRVLLPRDGAAADAAAARFAAALLDAVLDAAAETRARNGGGSGDGAPGGAAGGAGSGAPLSAAALHEVAPLPFELTVLEAALHEVTAAEAVAVKELEAVATPALDALTRTVTTNNLERVRKIKTRHQRLLARVQSMREELQSFLDDDADMFRMCLTRRAEAERADRADRGGADRGTPGGAVYGSSFGRRASAGIPFPGRLGTPGGGGGGGGAGGGGERGGGPSTSGDGDDGDDDAEALETVENLLDSYFMQVDAYYDRLVSMEEYIKDTEEYINIELDSARNRLIRLEIVVTAGTFGIGIWSLVAGILGENLVFPEPVTKTVSGFVTINAAAAATALGAFLGIMGYIKYMRLI